MFLPEGGVLANARVEQPGPDQGASQTHWEEMHKPLKEHSISVVQGVEFCVFCSKATAGGGGFCRVLPGSPAITITTAA